MNFQALMQTPAMQDALADLLKEVQDVVSAPDSETRNKELVDLLIEALEAGLVAGAAIAKSTPTIVDDIAVSGARMANLPLLIRALIDGNNVQ